MKANMMKKAMAGVMAAALVLTGTASVGMASVYAEEKPQEEQSEPEIAFEEGSYSVKKGGTITLKLEVDPKDFADTITFESDNTDYLTIESKNDAAHTVVVKGIETHNGVIVSATAKDAAGNVTAYCNTMVAVTDGDPVPKEDGSCESIDVPDSMKEDVDPSIGYFHTMTVGDSFEFAPVFTPASFEDEIDFSDDEDSDVVTLDWTQGAKTATVKATAAGEEIVHVQTLDSDGERTAYLDVTFKVKAKMVACTQAKIKEGASKSIYTTEKLTLNGTVTPTNATEAKSWKITSGAAVVKITPNAKKTKCTVTPKKAGTAKVQFKCGSKTDVITITVKKPTVTLKASKLTVKKGKTGVIIIKSKAPTSDTLSKAVSSAPGIVEVIKVDKKNGKVTVKGVKKGKSAKVTLTMASGAKAVCTVTVKK